MRNSLVPRLSSIGRQAARQAATILAIAARVDLAAEQCGSGVLYEQAGRGHRADRNAGSRARAAVVERQVDRDPCHRDIHLGARGEAQIGIARTLGARGEEERGDDLVLGERGLAGAGRDLLDRHLAHAFAADDAGDGAGGIERRHAVGAGGCVAQVAADRGAALDLDRADQLDAVDDAWPRLGERLVVADRHAGSRRADTKAAVLGRDADQLGDLLEVDDQLRLDRVGLHLHDDVGAAGEQPRRALRSGQQRHCRIHSLRRLVSEFAHLAPGLLASSVPVAMDPFPHRMARKERAGLRWGQRAGRRPQLLVSRSMSAPQRESFSSSRSKPRSRW